MTHRPIIDAGPGLNFFSINKERLLIETLGPLCAPETVRDEILRKSRQDNRFAAAQTVWNKLPERLMQVLPDDETPELAVGVNRIGQLPMPERMKHSKDLGEIMVIAHAVVAAEAGHDVMVLIDDDRGARLATSEIKRLGRLRASGRAVGTIKLVNTVAVPARAEGKQYLPDKASVRETYMRLRRLDDGLPPIETTDLLTAATWRS